MAIAQADGRANSERNSRSKNRVNRTFPAILHQKSCPPTPEQKGLAERQHRHIVEQRLATMYKASIPLGVVFESTVFVINRLPSAPNGSTKDPTKFPKPSFSEKAWYPSTHNNLNVELKKHNFLLREESNRREASIIIAL